MCRTQPVFVRANVAASTELAGTWAAGRDVARCIEQRIRKTPFSLLLLLLALYNVRLGNLEQAFHSPFKVSLCFRAFLVFGLFHKASLPLEQEK